MRRWGWRCVHGRQAGQRQRRDQLTCTPAQREEEETEKDMVLAVLVDTMKDTVLCISAAHYC